MVSGWCGCAVFDATVTLHVQHARARPPNPVAFRAPCGSNLSMHNCCESVLYIAPTFVLIAEDPNDISALRISLETQQQVKVTRYVTSLASLGDNEFLYCGLYQVINIALYV